MPILHVFESIGDCPLYLYLCADWLLGGGLGLIKPVHYNRGFVISSDSHDQSRNGLFTMTGSCTKINQLPDVTSEFRLLLVAFSVIFNIFGREYFYLGNKSIIFS